MESHPLRMRGLKLTKGYRPKNFLRVASFTDAWIETSVRYSALLNVPSHPLRMRGLKPFGPQWLVFGACRILYGCVD